MLSVPVGGDENDPFSSAEKLELERSAQHRTASDAPFVLDWVQHVNGQNGQVYLQFGIPYQDDQLDIGIPNVETAKPVISRVLRRTKLFT